MELKCPICNGVISAETKAISCDSCGYDIPYTKVEGKELKDFRCLNVSTDITLTFTIPVKPLATGAVEQFGLSSNTDGKFLSREKVRRLYGTKLQKEIFYYIDRLENEIGKDAAILDLGCGNGGNKKYLESLGFKKVVSVDYYSAEAEYLVDVHRMPFASESFDLILTTQTLEHFYNPYIAFSEMNRVLKKDGILLASGSFWESWHGNSCFHFTPGGLELLCRFSRLHLIDLWVGWGFIPSVSSHALGLKRFKRYTYILQRLFYFLFNLLKGSEKTKRHRFNTAGSFGLCARKL